MTHAQSPQKLIANRVKVQHYSFIIQNTLRKNF